jgi:hypothetical protein
MLPWLRISLFEEKGWASQLHKRNRDVVKGTDDEMQRTTTKYVILSLSGTYH